MLCGLCGLSLPRESAGGDDAVSPVCAHHLVQGVWSAKANRIWCDYFHRREPIERIPQEDDEQDGPLRLPQ